MTARPDQRLRVVIIDEEFPFPPNSGKRIRTLNLVERLAQRHDIVYVAHRNADRDELLAAREYLGNLGIRTVEVPRRIQPKSGIVFYTKLLLNLFSSLPYSVASHTSSEMKTQLETLRREFDAQIWHCEWTPYAEVFRNFNVAPLVIAAHNVESLIWKRYAESEKNLLKRWYIQRQYRKFSKFERWAFGRASRIITVSDDDARLAAESFGAKEPQVVQNGVDPDRYRPVPGNSRNPKRMIFLGSLDWRPNLDGIQQFLATSFPAIMRAEPKAELSIVGRHPPAWLAQRAAADQNIHLHGNVPDVTPFLAEAGVMIVPLRIGGGSRLKIIEAAANELPVVSTRVGAEGLRFVPQQDYFVAESIEEMTAPVLHAMRSRTAAEAAAKSARQVVDQHYNWDALANIQSEIWQAEACPAN